MAAKKKAAPVPPAKLTPIEPPKPKQLSYDNVVANLSEFLARIGKKPYPSQLEVIKKAVDYYNAGARYVVLESPVGSGKSAIANAIAREMGTSYTLTLSEQLQDQYVKDFNEYGVEPLKGRGKFSCHNMGRVKGKPAGTCADGKHFFSGKTACANCPYQIAKEKALNAEHCVANYHSYLYNVGFGSGPAGEAGEGAPPGSETAILNRDLTIVDECHAAESFLLGIVGVEIHLDRLPFPNPPPPRGADVQPYMDYVEKELLPRCKKALAAMVDPKAKEDLEGLMAKCRFMLSSKDDTWIVDRGEKDNGDLDPTWFGMKPLFVHHYGRWLLGGGDRYLLMSGTVLSAAHLVEALGLDPATGDLIEMPSQFPVENRPVYAHALDMTMKSRDENWPKMAEELNRILDFHANEKGLILPQSNAMSKYILERLTPRNRARIITASGEGRMEKFREHTTSTQPTVLMAPGMWEGVDLKGDLSRFQVIPSFPRPPWKGHTKARAEKEKGWYRLQTMTKGMQGMGRSVRSETDHAITYVLDRDFLKECGMATGMVPGWLKDAVHPWDESPHLKAPVVVVAQAVQPKPQPRRR